MDAWRTLLNSGLSLGLVPGSWVSGVWRVLELFSVGHGDRSCFVSDGQWLCMFGLTSSWPCQPIYTGDSTHGVMMRSR